MPENLPAFAQQAGLSLLLFGGKGGVGKTTCAAATALRLAARFPTQAFLIASTDPAHSLRHALGGAALPPNLRLLEIDAGGSFRKFASANAPAMRTIVGRGTFLDDEDVARLLDLSMPGLDELMAFNDISTLVESRAYSCIIVDTAPTGHTLRLLGLPRFLRNWLGALDAMLAKHRYLAQLYRGACSRDEVDLFLEGLAGAVERLALLLSDARRCQFVPVVLAEPLSVLETRRLVTALETLRIPVLDILINRRYPEASECAACRQVSGQQGDELRKLSREFAHYSLWEIPLHGSEVQGTDGLAAFWNGARPVG